VSRVPRHWKRLGIAPTDDRREIKRAYAKALKAIDPERDPQAFLDLREAYETALEWGAEEPVDFGQIVWDQAEPPDIGEAGDVPPEDLEIDWGQFDDWRPAVPEEGGVWDTCAELDRLLWADAPDPAEIERAARTVLAHPELDGVDRAAEVEAWLAQAIAAATPRSDPVIPLAATRFGWAKSGGDLRRDPDVEWVLSRRDDIAWLARERGSYRRALAELTGPPRSKLGLRELTLAGDVRSFLDVVESEHRTVERDLDPDSVAWWRNYFHRRHLPPNFLLWMAVVPPALAFLSAMLLAASGPVSLTTALLLYPPALALTFAAFWLKAGLDYRSREREATRWDVEAPRTYVERNVLLALALPPLAALLTDLVGGRAWAWFPALALAFATARLSWIDPDWEVSTRLRVFQPIVAAGTSGILLFNVPPAMAIQLSVPLAAMCWLGSRAYAPVRMQLQSLPRATRLAARWAALVLSVAAFIPVAVGAPEAWPAALTLAPVAMIAAHLATADARIDIHLLEWPLRIVGLCAYWFSDDLFGHGEADGLLFGVAVYGLLYAVVRVFRAILDEA
jgi:hypothetical protein